MFKIPSKLKKNFKIYVYISIFLFLLIGFFLITRFNLIFGLSWSILGISFILGIIYFFRKFVRSGEIYIDEITQKIDDSNFSSIQDIPIMIAILDKEKRIEWANKNFDNFFGNKNTIGRFLSDVSEDLEQQIYLIKKDELVTIKLGEYRILSYFNSKNDSIYLLDVTEYAIYKELYENERIVAGLASIDNYDEITQDYSESQKSELRLTITKLLSEWSSANDVYIKRISNDNYLFLSHYNDLLKDEKDHFEIINKIRNQTLKENKPVTISMGVASGIYNLNELFDKAKSNLELAFGRGGDQAVVKDEDKELKFFGGNVNPLEKRTRVKARIVDSTLDSLIKNASNVVIVGHKNMDLDSFGSAVGIWRISQINGKKASIVFNENDIHNDIRLLVEKFRKSDEERKEKDEFANSEEFYVTDNLIAPNKVWKNFDQDTLIIEVDHSVKTVSEVPEFFENNLEQMVIIDHHRRGKDQFNAKPLLTYIEPYASSTSELVTELLQYENRLVAPLHPIEATALLGGIQLDTKSFTVSAGSRTFDAASFLKSVGASMEILKEIAKEPSTDILTRAKLIEISKIENKLIFSVGEENIIYNSIVAAQTADELLTIENISASFVIYKKNNKEVGVSARSDGSINVQAVLESIGGGGHLNTAAAAVPDQTPQEVYKRIKIYLDENN